MKRPYLFPTIGIAIVLATIAAGAWFVLKARSAALQKENAYASARTHTLRDVTPPPLTIPVRLLSSDADAAFQTGLQEYKRRNYLTAITSFYAASKLDPGEPAAHFLLGICYLMTNDTRPAISELRMVTTLKESEFIEPAYYYMAKAYLRQGDNIDADRELNVLLARGGRMKDQARDLKAALAAE